MANTPALPPKVIQGAIANNGDLVVAGCSRASSIGVQIATQAVAQPGAPTLNAGNADSTLAPGTYQVKVSVSNQFGEVIGSAASSITTAGALAAPAQPTLSTLGTGGTVAAGVYQVEITYVNAQGETTASVSNSVTTTGTTSTITINSPAASGNATGWYAYVTQAGGNTYTRQQAAGSPTNIGTNLTLTAPPTNTGANPPLTNTASASPQTIIVSSPTVPEGANANHWNVYCTAVGGSTFYLQNSTPLVLGPGGATTYTIASAPSTTGAAPPSAPAFTGTITFKASIDGVNFNTIGTTSNGMVPFPAGGTGVNSATAAGMWTMASGGLVYFQAVATTAITGMAIVTIAPTGQ